MRFTTWCTEVYWVLSAEYNNNAECNNCYNNNAEYNNCYWVLSAAPATPKVEDQKSRKWAEAKIQRVPQPPARKACGVTSLGLDFCACMCIYRILYRKFCKNAKYRKSERFPVQSSVRYTLSFRWRIIWKIRWFRTLSSHSGFALNVLAGVRKVDAACQTVLISFVSQTCDIAHLPVFICTCVCK